MHNNLVGTAAGLNQQRATEDDVNPDDVLNLLFEFLDAGATTDDLVEDAAIEDSPELYDGAIAAFGAWDAFLAAALVSQRAVVREPAQRKERVAVATAIAALPPDRVVGADASLPLVCVDASGAPLALPLPQLAASRSRALHPLPPGPSGPPTRMFLGNPNATSTYLLDTGHAVSLDFRLLPEWDPFAASRPLYYRWAYLPKDASVVDALLAPDLRAASRYYIVSQGGNVKATDASELRRAGSDEWIAVLVRDGDALQAMHCGSKSVTLFVANATGKAIAFDTAPIRSQGRKATGVRAIQLDDGDRVTGSFVVVDHSWVILSTAEGYLKRMPSADFRIQGRGGAGLQTCKVASGDRVVSVIQAGLAQDIIVTTSNDRFARFPVADIPSMGRPARGERFIDLDRGEELVASLVVPAGELED